MMDEEMKDEVMAELKKVGIEENMMDDYLIWGAKKMMFGLAKMRWSLKENGLDEAKAKETIKKIVDMMMQKEMMDKMQAKMEEKWSK